MLQMRNVLYSGWFAQGFERRERKVRLFRSKRGWREARFGRRLWSRMRVWRLGTEVFTRSDTLTISFLARRSSWRRDAVPKFDNVVRELSVRS